MKTSNGIVMMTAGEIIAQLKKFPADEVVVFTRYDQETGKVDKAVLQSIQNSETLLWNIEDDEVVFRDEKGKRIFSVEKTGKE